MATLQDFISDDKNLKFIDDNTVKVLDNGFLTLFIPSNFKSASFNSHTAKSTKTKDLIFGDKTKSEIKDRESFVLVTGETRFFKGKKEVDKGFAGSRKTQSFERIITWFGGSKITFDDTGKEIGTEIEEPETGGAEAKSFWDGINRWFANNTTTLIGVIIFLIILAIIIFILIKRFNLL